MADKEYRGFAAMDQAKQREIASKGGKAAHKNGKAHKWTSEQAKAAGRKGGKASNGGRGRSWTPPVADPVIPAIAPGDPE